MNEALNRLTKQSGAMWAALQDRGTSPVIVKLDDPDTHTGTGKVFELTLTDAEGYSFWQAREREMTPVETVTLRAFVDGSLLNYFGLLIPAIKPNPNGAYHRVGGYVFNGRKSAEWTAHMERVKVEVEPID